MKKTWLKIVLKVTAVTVGILLSLFILFGRGLIYYAKHNLPYWHQEFVVEIKDKRFKEEYHCSFYIHDADHDALILKDYKGKTVIVVYKTENTFITIEPNHNYDPDQILEEIKKEQEKQQKNLNKMQEKKIPKKMV